MGFIVYRRQMTSVGRAARIADHLVLTRGRPQDWLESKGMAVIQGAVVALLARAVFWRSSQGKRLGVDRLTGGRPPMTISARR
jgi:hypothetical protein